VVLTDEIKTLMLNNDAPIGIGYSGDAAFVISENPAVEYIVPEDGGAIWTDNFAIPKMEQMEHYEYLGRDAVEIYNDLFLEWKLGL